jgi:hypothetical protein
MVLALPFQPELLLVVATAVRRTIRLQARRLHSVKPLLSVSLVRRALVDLTDLMSSRQT